MEMLPDVDIIIKSVIIMVVFFTVVTPIMYFLFKLEKKRELACLEESKFHVRVIEHARSAMYLRNVSKEELEQLKNIFEPRKIVVRIEYEK